MNIINLKYNNNYEVARQLFDNIVIYASKENPAQELSSFIGEIEKVLDKVENKGYDRAKNSCCREY